MYTIDKRIKDILIFSTISFFGITGIIETWRNDSWDMFPSLSLVFMTIAGYCSLIYTMFYIVKSQAERGRFSPPAIATIFYGAVIVFLSYGNSHLQPDKMMYASYFGDFNGTSITLRKDGTYQVENSTWGGGKYYRGDFQMKGDTILLDHKIYFYDDFYLTEKLLIENKLVYQLDAVNHKLENEMQFKIND